MTFSISTSDRNSVNAAPADLFKKQLLKRAVQLAMDEDFGPGRPCDLTTEATVDPRLKVKAVIYCKQSEAFISGLSLIGDVFRYLEPEAQVKPLLPEGAHVKTVPQAVAEVTGKASTVLGAERTALNLLQRMSGITTLTRRFVERAQPHNIKILDTRKTTPGLRVFERYAVLAGGGVNHRFGLNEKILLKDNHIHVAGGVTQAIQSVRKAHPQLDIEVECTNLPEIEESLKQGVQTILLDNMTPEMVRQAIALIDGSCLVEISGGITLDNLESYLLPGVDAISVGALTHSVKSVDLSLEVEQYL